LKSSLFSPSLFQHLSFLAELFAFAFQPYNLQLTINFSSIFLLGLIRLLATDFCGLLFAFAFG